jgi:hypothetical protein
MRQTGTIVMVVSVVMLHLVFLASGLLGAVMWIMLGWDELHRATIDWWSLVPVVLLASLFTATMTWWVAYILAKDVRYLFTRRCWSTKDSKPTHRFF